MASEIREKDRLIVSTWDISDGPDQYFVSHAWSHQEWPTHIDPIAGPFATIDEVKAARDVLRASPDGR